MDMRIIRAVMLAVLSPMLMGASCEPVVRDSSFELWCGDHLCAWRTDRGSVRRVPTWHEKDFGVELLGDGARISQHASLDEDAACLRFELTAEIEDHASLILEMDFLDDGVVEFSQIVPSAGWAPLRFDVPTPAWYSGVRFIVRKTGPGRAILAQLDVSKSDGCTTARPSLPNRPLGAVCSAAGDCASGKCEKGDGFEEPSCSGCATDADCAPGEACGLEAGPLRSLYRACGPKLRHLLGERCAESAECATGVCCGGVCSECCAGAGPACSGGRACEHVAIDPKIVFLRVPSLCAPGKSTGAPGAPCLGGTDCASGRCTGDGMMSLCQGDGRRCTVPADCKGSGPDGATDPETCVALGTAGGRCE